MTNKRKIINDPVFGFITIPTDFIYDLLQHPYLNRLSRIKQLGLTHYVDPGTQHNRLQQSLGAMFLMTEAVKTLQGKGVEITDEEAEAVYAAILLHDIGHGPFSHALEGFFFDQTSHEELGIHIIERLNREEGITVLIITHHMNEAARADRILVLNGGRIFADGTPAEVFGHPVRMWAAGLDVPQTTELCYKLRAEGMDVPLDVFDADECARIIAEEYTRILAERNGG